MEQDYFISKNKDLLNVEEIQQFIAWNYCFAALGFGIGLPCLIWYFRNKGTWVEATETGIRSSWGQELEFDQITGFDKKKWEKKGIGVLSFESSNGNGKFVLDDLKYARKPMDEIVRLVESKIPVDMIVNGQPEKIPNQKVPTTDPEQDDQ